MKKEKKATINPPELVTLDVRVVGTAPSWVKEWVGYPVDEVASLIITVSRPTPLFPIEVEVSTGHPCIASTEAEARAKGGPLGTDKEVFRFKPWEFSRSLRRAVFIYKTGEKVEGETVVRIYAPILGAFPIPIARANFKAR